LNAYYVFLKFAKLWELNAVRGAGFEVVRSPRDNARGRPAAKT